MSKNNEYNEIQESITRNTSVMMGAQIVTWASSFILLMYLPKYLGSDNYGKLFIALSISMMIEVLIDFGGGYLIPKEVSRTKSKTAQVLSNFGVVRFVIWLVAMIFLIVFSYIAGYPPITQLLIIILGFSRLWEGAKRVLRSGFQGHERMEYPSIAAIAERVFISALVVSALLMGFGPVAVALIMAAGVLINLIVLLLYSPKIVDHFPKVEWGETASMIQVSIPYFLWSLFSIIYYRVDAIMLSLLTSDSVVGWYGASYRFFDIVMVFPSIFTTVVFPIFARLWVEQKNQLYVTFQKSVKFMALLAFPVAAGILFYSTDIVELFFGIEEYQPSIIILQIFAISIPLVYIDFILGSTILATDKQKKWAFVGLAAIFINVILNFYLIPFSQAQFGNGGIGAAISTFGTEAFILLFALLMLPENYTKALKFSYFSTLSVSIIIMVAVMWGGYFLNIPWIIAAILAAITYLLCILNLGVLEEKERTFVLSYISPESLKKYLTKRSETTI
ncbi:MAG TPA: flippase [Gracilimonas sp.]|uniref:flippase n=1 Tax=Gracilimonas sp. TaxID=1974203 RepID=UPI002D95A86E|nr:flippase [Gracilimonas sp.]